MEQFPKEFSEPFKMCFDLLKRSRIEFYNVNESLFQRLSRIFLVFCVSSYILSLLVFMSKFFSGDVEFLQLAYVVPVVLVAMQGAEFNWLNDYSGILKAAIVEPKKDKIRGVILQLGSSWRTDNLTTIQITKKNDLLLTLRRIQFVFYWMNILGSWQYMLVPLYETLFRKFILQQHSEFLFPFACSFPFNTSKTWTRYIAVYIFQIYSMLHLVYVYLGAEFLMITLCAHLTTEFILLQEDIRNVKPSSNKNKAGDVTMAENDVVEYNRDYDIKDIVRRHQRLIMLSQQLNDIFNRIIFINIFFASIIICFFGLVAMMARGVNDVCKNIFATVASMVPIFNLCYYGEILTCASADIASSAYESLWYDADANFKKILHFIIRRSQRPCHLTSLKYAPISLNTFATVMSTTWSYFSLAKSLFNKGN